jgi:hypothetical protein
MGAQSSRIDLSPSLVEPLAAHRLWRAQFLREKAHPELF